MHAYENLLTIEDDSDAQASSACSALINKGSIICDILFAFMPEN